MLYKYVVKGLEWVLILTFSLMVLLVFGNVVLRYGFNEGIMFSEEVSRFLFVWMVFLGSTLMLKNNGHLGVQTLTQMLGLRGKKFCKLVGDLASLMCCLLMTAGGWKIVQINMVNYAPVSDIPLGVVYSSLLFSGIAMSGLLIASIYRLLSGKMTENELSPKFDDAL